MSQQDAPPPAELSMRMNNFRAVLRARRLEAALIVDGRNVRYLSGFTGSDSALLVTPDEQFLLTDFRFVEEAAATAKGWKAITEPQGMMEKAGALAQKNRLKTLAIEPGAMRLTDLPLLRAALGKIKIKQEHCMVAELRLAKSAWEVQCIERALAIQESCYHAFCARLKEGITEREAVAKLRCMLLMAGAGDQAFETLFQIGSNTSIPHGGPTDRRLLGGAAVLLDFGVVLQGYHTDLTRTFFWGKVARPLCKIHAVVLEAHRNVIAAIAPGVALAELDRAAHAVIDKAGYGNAFRHSCGHGVGLDIHEYPALSQDAKGMAREGMVLAIEPGVYLPGIAGIRVEDMVLVTKNGCRVLSRLKHGVRWDGSPR